MKALVEGVAKWNEMIAAFVGRLSDATGAVEAPIKHYANFEHLEFKGQSEELAPFLHAMTAIAKATEKP